MLRSGAGRITRAEVIFSDLGVKLPKAELGGCETSVSAKLLVSLTPWELLPWLLTHVGGWWGLAQHPPFAVDKPTPCLQTKAPKWV